MFEYKRIVAKAHHYVGFDEEEEEEGEDEEDDFQITA